MKRHTIAEHIYPKKTIERIKQKIMYLGPFNTLDTYTFLHFRLIVSILIFVIVLLFSKHGAILAPILVVVFYYGSEKVLLDERIRKRTKKLEDEAIFFFEVLSLTLETNPYLKGALELTTKNIDSELSLEFQKTLSDVSLGKSFSESLVLMKERIPSDAINTILLNLTESSIFGNNIVESLKNQLEYLRDKKLLEIKGEIAKLPMKMSILSVLFFIPIMLLIILAPVLLDFFLK